MMKYLNIAALLLGLTGCDSGSAAKGTNLLLITLDTTRADRLGAYGYQGGSTPILDSLALSGVTFEEAYTPAPMTLPAHATMLTGLLPPEHGARVNGVHKLSEEVPTLGELLGEEGYRSGAFVAAFVLDARFGLARGFDHYDDDLSAAYSQDTPGGLSTYRPGEQVVDSALTWLKHGEEPFFAWVHLYDAHYPWHPHGDGVEDASEASGTYDGEVTYMDAQVGRLLQHLEDEGLSENTLVVAVADHGEGLRDHHEIEHAYLLNEEVLHIPWFMRGPGIQAGHRVQALVSLEDLQPTVLELLGVDGFGANGRSLVAALSGESIPSGESYAETQLPWTSYRWAPQYSLTTEEWKYVRTPQTELYSRERDRGELANLAGTKLDVVAKLDARLREIESAFIVHESEEAKLSDEENEQLAALGYTSGSMDELPEEVGELADVKQRLAAKDLAADLRQGIAKGLLSPAERVEFSQRLIALSPETPSFLNGLGEAYIEMGDLESALGVFEKVLDMVPTDAGVHYAFGDALQQSGRTPEAREHLEMALSLSPDMAAAHVGLGNVFRSEGRPDLAAGAYSEALRLRPEYPEAHFNLGQSFLDRNMVKAAIENFDLALKYREGWTQAHSRLARLHLEVGSPGKAREHFEEALASVPGDVGLNIDLGLAFEQLGMPEQAREQYLKAIDLNPQYFRPYVNLGNLAFGYGNDAIALEQYEKGFQVAPNIPEPAARLARFLSTTPVAELRQGERAVALAEAANEMSMGNSAVVLDTLAAAYACVEEYPMAMAAALQAKKRASLDGNRGLAEQIQKRWALYATNQPYVQERLVEPQGE